MRKIVLFLILLLILTIVFLLAVLIVNRDSGKGALQVTSKPESQVFLDGKFVGKTPLCLCELSQLIQSGEYSIKLIPLGKKLKTVEQKITIYKGALTVVDKTFDENNSASSGSIITLSPAENERSTELMIISFPGSAQVILDSNIVGQTPLLLKDVTPSDHEIKILKEGYREKIIKVKTIEGKRLEGNITLGIKVDAAGNRNTSSVLATSIRVVILETPTGFLRVREENSLNSAQIDTVTPGQKFELISEEGDWYEILLSGGKTGWISKTYARKE